MDELNNLRDIKTDDLDALGIYYFIKKKRFLLTTEVINHFYYTHKY